VAFFSKKLLPHTCELKGKKGSTGRKHVSKAPPTLFTLEDRLFDEGFWIIPKDFIFVDVFLVFLGGFCLPQLDPEKRSATEMVGSHWSARRLDKVTRNRKR
jgi:hypothetical protein